MIQQLCHLALEGFFFGVGLGVCSAVGGLWAKATLGVRVWWTLRRWKITGPELSAFSNAAEKYKAIKTAEFQTVQPCLKHQWRPGPDGVTPVCRLCGMASTAGLWPATGRVTPEVEAPLAARSHISQTVESDE